MVADTIRLDERAQRVANWLTTERVAYGLVAVAALGVRLWGLAATALTPGEAAQALSAAQAVSGSLPGGTLPDLAGVSPLVHTLQRLTFMLFGATDGSARFWTALIGGLSPLLFFALRDKLTRGGALMAALLWALSPLAVWSGRLGLGDSLVAPLALVLLAAMAQQRWREENAPGWPVLAAVALGLLLISGSNAYTVLLAVTVGALLAGFDFAGLASAWTVHRKPVLGALAATVVLGSTFFLLTPAGLASAAGLAGEWLRSVVPGNGEYAPWEPVYRLVMSEFALFGFGLGGAAWALRRGDRFGIGAAIATAIVWFLSIAGRGRHPVDLAPVALGLALLAGPAATRVLQNAGIWLRSRDSWVLVGVSAALLFAALLALPGAWNPNNRADWRTIFLGIFIATSTLFIVIWIAYGVWESWQLVGRTLPVVLFAFAFAWQLSQMAGLSHDRGAWRQPGVVHETAARGVLDFRETLRGLSALKRGGPNDAAVDLVWPQRPGDSALALLRWELRDFDNLRVRASVPPDAAPIVIGPLEEQPRLVDGYSGADFPILASWRPTSLGDFNSYLRWVLYRDARSEQEEVRAILWFDRAQR
jgi:hypothetical protein